MNKNRKGFTIVELVIVIAIIAILAAVLIPTFASLIAKANVSVDTQLVRNLNNALTAEKAGGENNKTMYDALMMVKSAGYDIDTIVSKSGNNIAWDSKNDRFVLIDPNNNTYIYPTESGAGSQTIANPVDFFVIYNEVPTAQKYSIYLSKNATVAAPVEVKVGFDAGENPAVTELTYTGVGTAQKVVIRTNSASTDLTINAPLDTVTHYDEAKSVEIIEVADHSYHEYGKTDKIILEKGNLVIESEAHVPMVIITASDAANVKLEVKSEENSPVITATNEGVKNAIASGGENFKIPAESVKDYNGITASNVTLKDGVNVLLEDISLISKTVTTTSNDNVILDLNGHKWECAESQSGKHYYAIDNYGTFTLIDSVGGGKISARGIENKGSNSIMYIKSGRIESIDSNGGGAAVWNEGTLYVSGGELVFTGNRNGNSSGTAINNTNTSKAYVTGGVLFSKALCIWNNGYMEVSNVTIDSTETDYFNAIKNNYGEMILKNIKVSAKKGGCIENVGGKLTIENCELSQVEYFDHNSNCISTNYGGETIIKNSEISASTVAEGNNYCIYVYSTGGKITIEGGSFSGGKAVLKADKSTTAAISEIIVNGGTFDGAISIAEENAKLTINGGEFNVTIPTQTNITDNRNN